MSALSALLAIAAVATFAGCAAMYPPGAAPPSPAEEQQVSRLTQAVAQRQRALDSLRCAAIMEYWSSEEHVKAREEIVLRRPASLRVEAMSPFGVALVLAAQGARLQIFEPSNNTFMTGTANAQTLARFVRIPMEPRDAVALLMAVVPGAQSEVPPERISREDGLTLLSYRAPGGSARELGFAGNQLALVRERDGTGATSYEVRYSDYRDIGGIMFPYQVNADFPGTRSRVSFRYQRPIINGEAPDSTFLLTPGAGAKLVDIGMARTLQAGGNG